MADTEQSIPECRPPSSHRRIAQLCPTVVAKIAAGEIVQRPYNVVKECMENSMDAGATLISVTVANGGLSAIHMQDNGDGIDKADLPLLCRRHATSKLTHIDDLQTIQSYGFRGEALASMSQVARVSVVSRARDAPLAYSMSYDEHACTAAKPSAGNVGTVIRVDDLFYNMDTRRRALSNGAHEMNMIRQLVAHYALHSPHIGFTLKKAGAPAVDTKTNAHSTFAANMQALYTKAAADNIVPVTVDASHLAAFSATLTQCAFVHPSACSPALARKSTYVTFVNGRLVQWPALRRPLDVICQRSFIIECEHDGLAAHFPPPAHPFVFVSLTVPAHHVDVNVHPSKETVTLMNEDGIVQAIVQAFDTQLQRLHASRTYASQSMATRVERPSTQTILHVDGNTVSALRAADALPPGVPSTPTYAHHLVRTDATQPKIYESWRRPAHHAAHTSSPSTSSMPPSSAGPLGDIDVDDITSNDDLSADVRDIMNGDEFAAVELQSVLELRQAVCRAASHKLRRFVRDTVLIGSVDHRALLVQHATRMYRIRLRPLVRALLYQAALFRFSRIPRLQLSEALPLGDLIAIGNEMSRESPVCAPCASIDVQVVTVDGIDLLLRHAAMLDDYFSIGIDVHAVSLTHVPAPVEGIAPLGVAIAVFVHELCAAVDYSIEKSCFEGVLTAIATLYASAFVEDTTTVRTCLYPAVKRQLLPSVDWLDEQCAVIRPIVDLHSLYKVFERC